MCSTNDTGFTGLGMGRLAMPGNGRHGPADAAGQVCMDMQGCMRAAVSLGRPAYVGAGAGVPSACGSSVQRTEPWAGKCGAGCCCCCTNAGCRAGRRWMGLAGQPIAGVPTLAAGAACVVLWRPWHRPGTALAPPAAPGSDCASPLKVPASKDKRRTVEWLSWGLRRLHLMLLRLLGAEGPCLAVPLQLSTHCGMLECCRRGASARLAPSTGPAMLAGGTSPIFQFLSGLLRFRESPSCLPERLMLLIRVASSVMGADSVMKRSRGSRTANAGNV